jgi:hypothetical protein
MRIKLRKRQMEAHMAIWELQTNQRHWSFLMTTIPQLARAMSHVLNSVPNEVARQTGFAKRQSKLTGAAFVQTLVFGWQANPASTLSNLAHAAATIGVSVTPQALDQRFTEGAAMLLRQVLEAAVGTAISSAHPLSVPLLGRFNGVYLLDSTTIALPEPLQQLWSGCGGDGAKAALKLQVRVNLCGGELAGPLLQSGRTHDRATPLRMQGSDLPAGALRLADLGYFKLDTLRALDEGGIYWLTRLQSGTRLYDLQGNPLDLAEWLSKAVHKEGLLWM